jgi:hypothetical protein
MSQEAWEAFQQGFIGNEALEIGLGILAATICFLIGCFMLARGK